MKRIAAVFLCVILCASFAPKAIAADSRDFSVEESLASKLGELGLMRGVAKADGAPDFDLGRKPTRPEALVMFVRALGKDAEARDYKKTHPFTDVPSWADGYVSYAYDKGLTKGVSDTLFGAEDAASAEMYLTFMLRALGYSDKNYVYGDLDGEMKAEFSWHSPWALASYCGILPPQTDIANFLRADAVDVTCAALYANIKGTRTPLYERLVSEGAFTKAQFDKVFDKDPFWRFRQIDRQISAAIAAKTKLGKLEYDRYATECHIIADMYEENGVITVKPMVYNFEASFTKDNSLGTNGGGGAGPWLIKLDAKTLECLEYYTCSELAARGMYGAKVLGDKCDYADRLSWGMDRVCRMETLLLRDSGVIGYRQPTYGEAYARVTTGLSRITRILETNSCTLLIGWLDGTPHGSYAHLYLIYKQNSNVGEGEIIRLPAPGENYWGKTSEPDTLKLSEDCLTLSYSYHFNERLVMFEGLPEEYVIHEAGTYSYTVDLKTGVTTLNIIPD